MYCIVLYCINVETTTRTSRVHHESGNVSSNIDQNKHTVHQNQLELMKFGSLKCSIGPVFIVTGKLREFWKIP